MFSLFSKCSHLWSPHHQDGADYTIATLYIVCTREKHLTIAEFPTIRTIWGPSAHYCQHPQQHNMTKKNILLFFYKDPHRQPLPPGTSLVLMYHHHLWGYPTTTTFKWGVFDPNHHPPPQLVVNLPHIATPRAMVPPLDIISLCPCI